MNASRIAIAFCLACTLAAATPPYRTETFDKNVGTLQVKVADEHASVPVIELKGKKKIEINFDLLYENAGWIAYTLIHCNADWTPSGLTFSQALQGYSDLEIDDFAHSLGTRVPYTNYRLLLPNADVCFKASGNYVIKVFDEADPERVYFTACFSVADPEVSVEARIERPACGGCQQISFEADYPETGIPAPPAPLIACVYQNNRQDNAAYCIEPFQVTGNRAFFRNDDRLRFDAGNEYRRLEFLHRSIPGMHVEKQEARPSYLYLELMKDRPRRHGYVFDADQNGRFSLRSLTARDIDTEGEYALVRFVLECDSALSEPVYLNGVCFGNGFNESNRMSYRTDRRCYEKEVFLKQGSYDYQYLTVPAGHTQGYTGHTEGDYAETNNEYLVLVYRRDTAPAYDRLVGIKRIGGRAGKNAQADNKKFDFSGQTLGRSPDNGYICSVNHKAV